MPSRPTPAFARARRRAAERLARVTRAAGLGGVALTALAPGAAAQAPAAPAPADGVLNADHLRSTPTLDGPVRRLDGAAKSSPLTFGADIRLTVNTGGFSGTPVQADLDADGDLDLFLGLNSYGGYGSTRFKYYENTSGPGAPPTYAAAVDNPFNLTVFLSSAPYGYVHPALADMDGDGDLDLVVGIGGYGYAQNYFYVQNFGTPTAPNFFGGIVLGNGYSTYPTIGDLDGDGDNDLLLGTGGANNYGGELLYRENTGTQTAPAFAAPVANPFGLVATGVRIKPELADMDSDGDLDLLAGSSNANVVYYENTAAPGAPAAFAAAFVNPAGLGNNGNAIHLRTGDYDGDGDQDLAFSSLTQPFVFLQPLTSQTPAANFPDLPSQLPGLTGGASFAAPEFVDLDADGDQDVVMTTQGGDPSFRENTGTATAPTFSGNQFNAFGLQSSGFNTRPAPTLADFDGDGDSDVLFGNRYGELRYQENTGTRTAPAFGPLSTAPPFGLTDGGGQIVPDAGDFDGDGDIDVLVGAGNGSFRYFENTAGPDATPAYDPVQTNPFGLTSFASNLAPQMMDLDGDGDLDVLAGNNGSVMLAYLNTAGPGVAPAFSGPPIQQPFGLRAQAGVIRPAAADLDADGDPDVLLGNGDFGNGGRLDYFQNRGITPTTRTARLTGTAGWRMLAAPTETEPFNDVLGDAVWTQGQAGADDPTGQPVVFVYDESVAGNENNGYLTPATLASPLPLGQGAFVFVFEDADPNTAGTQLPFPKTIDARGIAPVHTFEWAGAGLSYTDTGAPADDGWNLLGSPFGGSWFDWDAVDLVGVNAPVYVYDNDVATYRIANAAVPPASTLPGGLIAPFQGFWVQANAPSPSITARAGVANGGPLYKNGGPTVVGLRLRPADGASLPAQIEAQAFLAAGVAGAADGLDFADAWALGSPAAQHVALAVGDGRAIDARPELTSETTVEVAVSAVGADGPQALVLDWPGLDLPAGWTARLLDRETGTTTALADGGSYAFDLDGTAARDAQTLPALRPTAADGLTTGRFALVVTPAGVVSGEGAPAEASLSQAMPNPARGTARLALSLAAPERVRAAVYDALGRELAVVADGELAGAVELRVDTARLAAGVYVVRVEGETFAETRRLTVVR